MAQLVDQIHHSLISCLITCCPLLSKGLHCTWGRDIDEGLGSLPVYIITPRVAETATARWRKCMGQKEVEGIGLYLQAGMVGV